MLRVATNFLHNDADAEDVVQDVFGKILRLRKRDRDLNKAYLAAAVRNECLRSLHLRKRLRSIDPADFDERLAPIDVSTSPIEEMGDVLAAFAHLLPARQNAVFQLRALGAGTKEIALALVISEATVRSHLRYVRKVLKKERNKETGTREVCRSSTSHSVNMRATSKPSPLIGVY